MNRLCGGEPDGVVATAPNPRRVTTSGGCSTQGEDGGKAIAAAAAAQGHTVGRRPPVADIPRYFDEDSPSELMGRILAR